MDYETNNDQEKVLYDGPFEKKFSNAVDEEKFRNYTDREMTFRYGEATASEIMNFNENPQSNRDFDEPRETPEESMMVNDTDMTPRPVKAVKTAAPSRRK